MSLTFKKGDLVNIWLNRHYGVITGIITDLYDRDRTVSFNIRHPTIEKWATIEVLTDRLGIWPVEVHRLKKISEVQSA